VVGFLRIYLHQIKSRSTIMYKRKEVLKLSGNETFKNTSKKFSVLEFWQYGFSNLNSNVLRGALAEFLVENALKDNQEEIELRNPWGDTDVLYKDKKIEVKCSSYLQDWDQDKLSTIQWTGLKAKTLYWSSAVSGEKKKVKTVEYKSDIYVLALLKHQETETLDILDLDQWCFYVLTKDKLKEITGDRSQISLKKLEKNNIESVGFNELKDVIK
jgi:hypothetical protein